MPTRVERRELPTPDLFAIYRPNLVVVVVDTRVPQETLDQFLGYLRDRRMLTRLADLAVGQTPPIRVPARRRRWAPPMLGALLGGLIGALVVGALLGDSPSGATGLETAAIAAGEDAGAEPSLTGPLILAGWLLVMGARRHARKGVQ